MSIPDHARANFQTLLRAAASGDLALMECTEISTGVNTKSAPSRPTAQMT